MEMTQSVAKFYFIYDRETGHLINRVDRGTRAYEGDRAGSVRKDGYRVVGLKLSGKNKLFLEHRLIWLMETGEWPVGVDHINGKQADNRWCNLREANQQENGGNRRISKNNKCGYKGVMQQKGSNKFKAQITFGGKVQYLGYYYSPEEAHEMYCRVAKVLFGDFYNNGQEVA